MPNIGKHSLGAESPALLFMTVDDDTAIGEFLTFYLKDVGHEAEAYTHPEEALKAFRQDHARYHAIVSDVSMPEMNGKQFITRLREVNREIPVVVLTGTDRSFTDAEIRTLGILAVISKPFDLMDFDSIIELVEQRYR